MNYLQRSGIFMKTEIGKYLAVLSIVILLAACAPFTQNTTAQKIDSFADTAALSNGNNKDYIALANQYERLAQQMQAKAQHHKEKLKRLSHSIYFSKNKISKKTQAAFKFRKYQRLAEENIVKSAYYRKLSQQQFAHKINTNVKTESQLEN